MPSLDGASDSTVVSSFVFQSQRFRAANAWSCLLSKNKGVPILLIGLKVEIRTTPKKRHPVADIYWCGHRVAKVFIKKGILLARIYGNKKNNAEEIPLEHLQSAIALAESRLQFFENSQ